MWLTKKGKKTVWILGALLVAVICFAFSFTFVGKTQLRAKAIGTSVAYSKATETTKLTNLAGAAVCGTIGAAPGENISEVSITDAPKNVSGNYYYVIDNRGYTIFPAFTFEEPIKVADIDCLAFNICAYWASNHSPYGGYREGEGFVWTTKGIFLLGETSDGTEGVLLDPYFPTQSWTYWTIMGEDLNKLANDDGEITGFRIAAAIDTYGWTPVNQYAFDLGEVCVLETVDVTYMDGDTVLKTEKLAKGVDAVENYQAKKLGQELKGWKTADGEYYTDFSSPVTSSLTLYADFQSSTALDAYIISDMKKPTRRLYCWKIVVSIILNFCQRRWCVQGSWGKSCIVTARIVTI